MDNPLTTEQANAAAAGGILGGMFAIFGIFFLIYVILIVIARWKIFAKAGQKGWKSIIPIYSDYIEWKIAWKKINLFWVMIGLVVLSYILMMIGGMTVDGAGQMAAPSNPGPTFIIGCLLLIPVAVLDLMAAYKLFKSFGKGVGMFILYIFFPFIALPILGFGSAKYTKAQE